MTAAGGPEILRRCARLVDQHLERALPSGDAPPANLHAAMRYSLFAGGKRLRPALVMLGAESVGGSAEAALPTAAAFEMIHTYSLIHDDLPAMDNDDLRRGRPTNHTVYGEAVAILAGDALLTLAFEHVAARQQPAETATEVLRLMAGAAGAGGMVGGQALDLEAQGRPADRPAVEAIHARKTAALIRAAVVCGAVVAGAPPPARAALSRYGERLGLAFQIVDDILDVTSTPEALGKTPGKDAGARKATYPAAVGLDQSWEAARALAREAGGALAGAVPHPRDLVALAEFVVAREH
ncbi:MAG: polyprenyl synthetase family protein [Planctomycetes bacterium]|nr:polyprenyl synthetase family protein [Planctomycetota bacterium]